MRGRSLVIEERGGQATRGVVAEPSGASRVLSTRRGRGIEGGLGGSVEGKDGVCLAVGLKLYHRHRFVHIHAQAVESDSSVERHEVQFGESIPNGMMIQAPG